ncbi:MAG: glycosyltransferase [Pseudomonadota bacterium]
MRVLHISPTYLPAVRYGGPIQSVHGLCAGLVQRGHDVHVYTTNVDGDGTSDVPVGELVDVDGVAVTYFPAGAGRIVYRSPDMLAELDDKLGSFDVLHVHSVFLWPTMIAASRARRQRLPYVVSPRGMLVPELIRRKSCLAKRTWIELFERRNLAGARAVHVTTDAEAADIRRLGLTARKFAVIPNGIHGPPAGASTRPDPFRALGGPVLLFLGRVNWKKGLDRLIPALARVDAVQLAIVGNDDDGYRTEIEAMARGNGVADRVHFMGPLYGDEKWAAFQAGDVFALPSYSENFGIAVVEAMAAGTPVILTPEVGVAPMVQETGAGLVVDGTPEALGGAIQEIFQNPGLRDAMSEAGRRAAKEYFSWSNICERMEALYQDAVSNPVRV